MDKQIVALHKEEKKEELIKLLSEVTQDELRSWIDQRAIKGRGDPSALLKAILSGLPGDESVSSRSRLAVYKHCIQILQTREINSKTAAEIIFILMMEANTLSPAALAELSALYVENIRNGISNGKSLDLLPKLLWVLETKETVAYDGKEMTGAEYKSHVLNSLCSGRWDSGTVLHLAAMFKDVPLSQDELRFVLTKILRMLKDVDLQEIPPLVYQLLLLSNKGHKRLVLQGIITHFVQQDKQLQAHLQAHSEDEVQSVSADQLGLVEGTVILHITFAVKLDQDLGREFIKYIKLEQQSPTSIALNPFCIALSLSLSRIHRFEEQVMEFLKAAVLRSYKDQEKQQQSGWARDSVETSPDVTTWVIDTVKNSCKGWDHVIQGLVQLGFMLMDAYGPRASFGRVVETGPSIVLTPGQRACKLGADLLLETFKLHEMVRSEILEQILNRVVTKATAPVTHFLDLLSETIKSAPQILLDSLPKVREAFDYLSYLPPPTALALLRAVQPLLKISMTLKDALILVLRKAMFSRQVDARRTAVSGFLMILKHFKVLGGLPCSQASQSFSCSQVQVDVHIPYNPSSNEGLCLEILGNLRRCLGQQAEVRMTLYEGLYDVLCRNSQLSGPILSTLQRQLVSYYEAKEDVNPPVKLEPCIVLQGEDVYTAEPLAHLLSCVVQCYLRVKDSESDKDGAADMEADTLTELEETLESMIRRMLKSELEDFELDKSADFSMATGVGIRNNIFAVLVAGIYEVLLEYTFTTGKLEISSCETVLQLHQCHQRTMDILKDKPATGGAAGPSAAGKRGRPAAGKSTSTAAPGGNKQRSLLSLGVVCQIIRALYNDDHPAHQGAVVCLQESLEFQRYVLTVAGQKVTQIHQTGSCDGPEGHDTHKLFTNCCSMARVLQKFYISDVESVGEARREKQKQLSVLALDALATIYTTVCARYKDKITDFLSAVDHSRESGAGVSDLDLSDLLHKLIKKFQRLVISVITSEDDVRSPREAVLMLNIIGNLTRQLGVEGERGGQIVSWIQKICTDHSIDDLQLCKALITQLLQLSSQRQSCVQLLRDMARDVHSQLGDIDQDVEAETQSQMAIINPRSAAPTVLLLLTSHIDRELDDTEWVINRLKGALSASTTSIDNDPDSPGLTQRESQERTLCGRLGHLVNTFHEISQTAIPVGSCIEATVKVMCRMYGTLTLLVKYYLQMHQLKCGHLSGRFEKLVKLSAMNLTQYIYSMITYIQATQNELLQQTTDKSKKDKKKLDSAAQAGKARILKESKTIPNLIFAIEQYEKFLLQLDKKSKVNLMDNFKMSTARDFRINMATLQNALEEQSDTDDDDNDEEDKEEGVSEQDVKADITADVAADVTVTDRTEITHNEASDDDPSEQSEEENQEPPPKKSKVKKIAAKKLPTVEKTAPKKLPTVEKTAPKKLPTREETPPPTSSDPPKKKKTLGTRRIPKNVT